MPDTKPPTSEKGAVRAVTPWSTPVLDERETNRDLAWPRSVKTYAAQLNDAHIEGLYRGATLPIRAYKYWLDPNGAPDHIVQRISANYGLPIGADGEMHQRRTQRRFRFDRHLEDALRATVYGHYYFEQVMPLGEDGLYHVRKLAPRPPGTISEIKPARDGGLDFIKVPALHPGPGLALYGGVKLPVSCLVAYVWDQEGGNWRGRSMLRSLYRPWKLKDRVLRVGAINIERAGGVPYIEAPDGAGAKQMRELHELATQFRVGEGAGAALPHGATLKFASAAGGEQAINYVRLMNEEMARAWLMMFLQAGETSSGKGSTQQVESQVDYFAEIQHTIAGWVCDVFNEHQIEDDVEWNDGPDEPYAPLLRYTPKGDALDALAGALDDAQVEGALPADSQVAATVRGDTRPGVHARRARMQAQIAAAAPTPVEQAQADVAALQSAHEQALAAFTAAWAGVRAGVIDDLAAQVQAATTVSAVAALTAPAVSGAILTAALNAVLTSGAQSAVDEATAQGVTIGPTDLAAARTALADTAEATTTLLAASLAQSAASKAAGLWGAGSTPAEVADAVRTHLEALAGSAAEYELAGLATQAQNEGRFTAWEQDDQPGDFYASSVMDTNSCDPCLAENGEQFDSLTEARRDFPAGQFLGCKGAKRCRCAVVKVYTETPGQG